MRPYLSHTDVQRVYTILNECGEMWADARAWQSHLTASIETLIGGFTSYMMLSDRSSGTPVIIEARAGLRVPSPVPISLESFIAIGGEGELPGLDNVLKEALTHGLAYGRYRDYADRRTFEGSKFFEVCMRPIRAHDRLGAVAIIDSRLHINLSVARGRTDPRFSDRERDLLGMLAAVTAPQISKKLSLRRHKGRHDLSRRANEVLGRLLSGDSEKEVAARLGISTATVHEHVTSLYRYFGARSRGELMAYFLRRVPATKEPRRRLRG